MSADIVHTMMTVRDQVKLYHWQTLNYPRHIATNDLVPKLDANIDQFVEVYIAKYGRPKFGARHAVALHNFSDRQAGDFLRGAVHWLANVLPKKLRAGDTDLFNIRDTIVADLNQTLYLFTLK